MKSKSPASKASSPSFHSRNTPWEAPMGEVSPKKKQGSHHSWEVPECRKRPWRGESTQSPMIPSHAQSGEIPAYQESLQPRLVPRREVPVVQSMGLDRRQNTPCTATPSRVPICAFREMMANADKQFKPSQPLSKDMRIIANSDTKDAEKAALVPVIPQNLSEEQVTALQELSQKWRNRPKVRRSLSSLEYQKLQARFLFLGVVPEMFEDLRDEEQWSYTTTQTYFTAGLAAIQAAEMPIPAPLKLTSKLLTIMSKEEDAKRPTVPSTIAEINAASKMIPKGAALALQATFALGQRLGDMFKLPPSNIGTMTDSLSNLVLTTIVFKKGKTIKRTQPYTLHLDGTLGTELLEYTASCKGQPFLFDLGFVQRIREALHTVNPKLTILSIRRGGLQAMAQKGASIETILHHSRHVSTDTLMRYLEWGQVNLQHIRELQALQRNTNSERPQKTSKDGPCT